VFVTYPAGRSVNLDETGANISAQAAVRKIVSLRL
jgi:hypothetical protein